METKQTTGFRIGWLVVAAVVIYCVFLAIAMVMSPESLTTFEIVTRFTVYYITGISICCICTIIGEWANRIGF